VFEAGAVTGAHAHVGVHVETGDLCAPLANDRGLGTLAGTSQAQYATTSPRTRRDQSLHRGIGQVVEGQLLIFVFPSTKAGRPPPPASRSARNVAQCSCMVL
jgi:hypothetical protein